MTVAREPHRAPPAGASAAPLHGVFRLEGEYWTIGFGTEVCRLRDSAGVRYLAALLQRPGLSVPAAELVRLAGRSADTAPLGAERARVRVTHAIRQTLRRLAPHDANLNEHLRASIVTGARCAYRPDPRRAIGWEVSG